MCLLCTQSDCDRYHHPGTAGALHVPTIFHLHTAAVRNRMSSRADGGQFWWLLCCGAGWDNFFLKLKPPPIMSPWGHYSKFVLNFGRVSFQLFGYLRRITRPLQICPANAFFPQNDLLCILLSKVAGLFLQKKNGFLEGECQFLCPAGWPKVT